MPSDPIRCNTLSLLHPTSYTKLERQPQDSGWVSSRLTELLPMPLEKKQALLEESDHQLRLEQLKGWIRSRI